MSSWLLQFTLFTIFIVMKNHRHHLRRQIVKKNCGTQSNLVENLYNLIESVIFLILNKAMSSFKLQPIKI